jgi:hypothetical protein
VDDRIAGFAEQVIPLSLRDQVLAVVVLDEAVGFGDHLLAAPAEIDPECEARAVNGALQLRPVQPVLVEHHARGGLQW